MYSVEDAAKLLFEQTGITESPENCTGLMLCINAAIAIEREACANALNLNRSDALLMAGEMTAQEWRTVCAILKALQSRMRANACNSGCRE